MPREVESLQKNKATEFEYRKLFSLEEEKRPHALEQTKEGCQRRKGVPGRRNCRKPCLFYPGDEGSYHGRGKDISA